MQEGDVVLVQDSDLIRGNWKLAQVAKAVPGRDGKVRDVVLRYRIVNPGSTCDGKKDRLINRSVHHFVLLLPVEEQLCLCLLWRECTENVSVCLYNIFVLFLYCKLFVISVYLHNICIICCIINCLESQYVYIYIFALL